MKQKHKMKLWKKLLILIAVLLLAAGVGCGVYLGDYYHAESSAIEAITDPENGAESPDLITVRSSLHLKTLPLISPPG